MTDRELMQQALEALEWLTAAEPGDEPPINAAIAALRERLAQHKALDKLVAIDQELGMFEQPVQEPVAWVERWYGSGPELGWWIVCGRDHIAHLGADVQGDGDTVRKIVDAHNACIAPNLAQEPFAWLYRDSWGPMKLSQGMPPPVGAFPVYTTPQPRQWQGLTDEEMRQLQDANWTECEGGGYDWNTFAFARSIEAKLKEKNT